MTSADEAWEQFKKAVARDSAKHGPSVSGKLDVISAQINELKYITETVSEEREAQAQAQAQLGAAGAPPMDPSMMGAAPAPPMAEGAPPMDPSMMGAAPTMPVAASARKRVLRPRNSIQKARFDADEEEEEEEDVFDAGNITGWQPGELKMKDKAYPGSVTLPNGATIDYGYPTRQSFEPPKYKGRALKAKYTEDEESRARKQWADDGNDEAQFDNGWYPSSITPYYDSYNEAVGNMIESMWNSPNLAKNTVIGFMTDMAQKLRQMQTDGALADRDPVDVETEIKEYEGAAQKFQDMRSSDDHNEAFLALAHTLAPWVEESSKINRRSARNEIFTPADIDLLRSTVGDKLAAKILRTVRGLNRRGEIRAGSISAAMDAMLGGASRKYNTNGASTAEELVQTADSAARLKRNPGEDKQEFEARRHMDENEHRARVESYLDDYERADDVNSHKVDFEEANETEVTSGKAPVTTKVKLPSDEGMDVLQTNLEILPDMLNDDPEFEREMKGKLKTILRIPVKAVIGNTEVTRTLDDLFVSRVGTDNADNVFVQYKFIADLLTCAYNRGRMAFKQLKGEDGKAGKMVRIEDRTVSAVSNRIFGDADMVSALNLESEHDKIRADKLSEAFSTLDDFNTLARQISEQPGEMYASDNPEVLRGRILNYLGSAGSVPWYLASDDKVMADILEDERNRSKTSEDSERHLEDLRSAVNELSASGMVFDSDTDLSRLRSAARERLENVIGNVVGYFMETKHGRTRMKPSHQITRDDLEKIYDVLSDVPGLTELSQNVLDYMGVDPEPKFHPRELDVALLRGGYSPREVEEQLRHRFRYGAGAGIRGAHLSDYDSIGTANSRRAPRIFHDLTHASDEEIISRYGGSTLKTKIRVRDPDSGRMVEIKLPRRNKRVAKAVADAIRADTYFRKIAPGKRRPVIGRVLRLLERAGNPEGEDSPEDLIYTAAATAKDAIDRAYADSERVTEHIQGARETADTGSDGTVIDPQGISTTTAESVKRSVPYYRNAIRGSRASDNDERRFLFNNLLNMTANMILEGCVTPGALNETSPVELKNNVKGQILARLARFGWIDPGYAGDAKAYVPSGRAMEYVLDLADTLSKRHSLDSTPEYMWIGEIDPTKSGGLLASNSKVESDQYQVRYIGGQGSSTPRGIYRYLSDEDNFDGKLAIKLPKPIVTDSGEEIKEVYVLPRKHLEEDWSTKIDLDRALNSEQLNYLLRQKLTMMIPALAARLNGASKTTGASSEYKVDPKVYSEVMSGDRIGKSASASLMRLRTAIAKSLGAN